MKLSTAAGTNWQAIFYLALGPIVAMPNGWHQTVLLITAFVCMAIVCFSTKGSGISPEQGKEILDTAKELKDVLGEGRK